MFEDSILSRKIPRFLPFLLIVLLPPVLLLLTPPVADVARARVSPKPLAPSGTATLPNAFGDLNAGNVVYTVTNVGAGGYYDPINNLTVGSGFRLGGGPSALFHAGLVVASDATHVEDAFYGSDDNGVTRPFNFTSLCPLPEGSSPQIDQYRFCRFADGQTDGPPLGLRVVQHAYEWSFPPNNEYVVIEYEITSTLQDRTFYSGWYADWDLGDGQNNSAGYDASRRLGYMWDNSGANPNYYGIAALSHPLSGLRAVHNPTFVYANGEFQGDPGFEDADKFDFLTGFEVTSSNQPADWSLELGVGPFTVPTDRSVKVAFLMAAGPSLAALRANVDAARAQFPVCRPAVLCE